MDTRERLENADDKEALIKSLRDQSANEIEHIRQQTGKEIEARTLSVESQVRRIHDEESKRADSQIEAMERRAKTNATIEERRQTLALQKELIDVVLDLSETRTRQLIDTDGYRNALINWIVEGIVGLEATSVTVETTAGEDRIVNSLLPEAAERAMAVTGNQISIQKGENHRVGSPGVVIRDDGSARAFDNTIATRLRRYRSDIQRLIADRLYRV